MASKRGISQKRYENVVREDVYIFIVKPMIVLIGIYIVSALLEGFLNVKFEYFKVIFTGIGGIPYLIHYYKKELDF